MDIDMMDDPGTGGNGARDLLENLRDAEFGGSTEETAIALGRTPEEIEDILNGGEVLDEDLAMKVRGIAQERGVLAE
jgi:plasmid maintenance system antidote protein VapI